MKINVPNNDHGGEQVKWVEFDLEGPVLIWILLQDGVSFFFFPFPRNLRPFSFPVKFCFYINKYMCLRRYDVHLLLGNQDLSASRSSRHRNEILMKKILGTELLKPLSVGGRGGQEYNLTSLKPCYRDCCPI